MFASGKFGSIMGKIYAYNLIIPPSTHCCVACLFSVLFFPQFELKFLDANFDKFIVKLHYFHIFFILAKFQNDYKSITISSINCLNLSFISLKLCIKNKFIIQMVNNTQLAYMLRSYRTRNPAVRFLKYEFNNKLLNVVTLFRITLGIT